MSGIGKSQKKDLIIKGINEGLYPESVYKFRTIEKANEILQSLEFYFSSAVNFNDPFDCALDEEKKYSLSDFNTWINSFQNELTDAQRQILTKMHTQNGQAFHNLVEKIKSKAVNNRGVLALSKTNENILLWSHYAKNHTGVAIKLNIAKDPEFFVTPKNIIYTKQYNPLNYLRDSKKSIQDTLSIKSIDWEYEEEIRVYKSTVGVHKIDPLAITDVFFGIKTQKNDIAKIKNTCSENGLNHVKFYQAEKKYGEFALHFNPI
ncbi:hypothetical protein KLVA_32190 [Klebsiella variicola]|uniref:DUF2971 domain-containing protein n=1 Tax=Klebsiella variicola TaxID=244366 RepID=UPI000BC0B552|nr:DUF2971 domain-containing protein [Klebsiella variicola]APW88871.1 hypothetical protein AWN63_16155 [Klebsiella variicola]BCU61060.1 hypothetical protein KLVA_32190 [Klebsiella variicola]